MRNASGEEMPATIKPSVAFDDPEAMCRAALLGRGNPDRGASRAAASGERYARAVGTAMVRRRWTYFHLLFQPHTNAGEDTGLY